MKKKMSQKERVLAVLRCIKRGSWLPATTLMRMGIWRYTARIFELRRDGWSIDSEITPGHPYARYRLAARRP